MWIARQYHILTLLSDIWTNWLTTYWHVAKQQCKYCTMIGWFSCGSGKSSSSSVSGSGGRGGTVSEGRGGRGGPSEITKILKCKVSYYNNVNQGAFDKQLSDFLATISCLQMSCQLNISFNFPNFWPKATCKLFSK